MRKTVPGTILSALISLNITCSGQCPSNKGQWDIAASYGIITTNQVAAQFNTGDFAEGDATKTLTYNSGAAFISGRYFVFNRLALGIGIGVASEQGKYTSRSVPPATINTYTQSTVTGAMELYYIYSFRKYMEAYTLLGIGPSFTNITTNTATNIATSAQNNGESREDKFRAQYTPIGVRIGGKLGGFLELGYGYKGVINGGISYKFGQPCWWKFH